MIEKVLIAAGGLAGGTVCIWVIAWLVRTINNSLRYRQHKQVLIDALFYPLRQQTQGMQATEWKKVPEKGTGSFFQVKHRRCDEQ